MKFVRLAAILTITLLLTGSLSAFAAEASGKVSTKVPSPAALSSALPPEGFNDAASRASAGRPTRTESSSRAQDFAVFGIIGLGIIGLLWIRRHTSEL